MQTIAKPPLYDRLGGIYSIATVVDDFIDRIMVDPRLNANPLVDEAHHRVPPAGFKYLVTEMVCWATGGPQKYTGKSMADSHRHLKITAGEWEAFLDVEKCFPFPRGNLQMAMRVRHRFPCIFLRTARSPADHLGDQVLESRRRHAMVRFVHQRVGIQSRVHHDSVDEIIHHRG